MLTLRLPLLYLNSQRLQYHASNVTSFRDKQLLVFGALSLNIFKGQQGKSEGHQGKTKKYERASKAKLPLLLWAFLLFNMRDGQKRNKKRYTFENIRTHKIVLKEPRLVFSHHVRLPCTRPSARVNGHRFSHPCKRF